MNASSQTPSGQLSAVTALVERQPVERRATVAAVATLDMDCALAVVVDRVREVHAPIWRAIASGCRPVTAYDCAALAGCVSALLDAIDARLPRCPLCGGSFESCTCTGSGVAA